MKQEPKLCQEPVTKEYFLVTKYKDFGNGNFISQEKRSLTKEELELNGLISSQKCEEAKK